MLQRRIAPFMILLVAAFAMGASKPDNSMAQYIKENTSTSYLIILASSRNFPALKLQAQSISRKIHMPFSMEGMIFDTKRGLIFPNCYPDDDYFLRRYNYDTDKDPADYRPYLSIEESDAYPGLKPGYYIIVAGIYDTPREAALAAKPLRKVVPNLAIRKTEIYYGCLH